MKKMKTILLILSLSGVFNLSMNTAIEAKTVSISSLINNLNSAKKKHIKESFYYLLLLGDRAVPRLVFALANKSKKIADNAAVILSKMKKPKRKVIPALMKAMRSKKTSVRINAAWALSMIKKPSSIVLKTLMKALRDKNKTVRFHAIWALIELKAKAKKALPILKRLRRDKDFYVKDSARYAINCIRKQH